MRRLVPLVIFATPALASGPPPLIAVLSGNWDGDGTTDAVVLVPGIDGNADLILYQGDGYSGLTPVLTLPSLVFAGPMAGQAPRLEARDATGFAVLSEQTGIARTPWMQSITSLWRDGGYVVAGYDYTFYDRLEQSHYGECLVNLLTSQYTLWHGPDNDSPEVHRQSAIVLRKNNRNSALTRV